MSGESVAINQEALQEIERIDAVFKMRNVLARAAIKLQLRHFCRVPLCYRKDCGMTIKEIEAAMQNKTPVEFYSRGGWLEPGWYPMQVAGIDTDELLPRVWLNYGRSGGVQVNGQQDVQERLRLPLYEVKQSG